MSVQDTSNDLLKHLLEELDIEVTVGIHEDDGGQSHGKGGITTAQVGAAHEFGLGPPQRSFVRGYFDEHQAEIEGWQDDAMRRILDGADPRAEATRVGLMLEAGMKERILARIEPPLAESTKRRRGEGAIPLIDSSQLLGSIRSKVRDRS